MNVRILKEEALLSYQGCMWEFNNVIESNDIDIYAEDLKKARIGDKWQVQDQDQCPNASKYWTVSYTVVYKNDEGVAVLYRNEMYDTPEIELIWVELAAGSRI